MEVETDRELAMRVIRQTARDSMDMDGISAADSLMITGNSEDWALGADSLRRIAGAERGCSLIAAQRLLAALPYKPVN